MNINKLKQAEKAFLSLYPKGFESEEIKEITKKHSLVKITDFAHESFTPEAMRKVNQTAENMIKLVSRSSIVSLFEKPRFVFAVAET